MDLFLFCREPLLASPPSVTTTRTWRGSGSGSRAFGRSTSGASPTTFLPSLLWTWLASGLLSSTASDFCSSFSCQCLYLFFFFCAFLWSLLTPLGYLVMLAAGSCCCCCSSYCLVPGRRSPLDGNAGLCDRCNVLPPGPPLAPPARWAHLSTDLFRTALQLLLLSSPIVCGVGILRPCRRRFCMHLVHQ